MPVLRARPGGRKRSGMLDWTLMEFCGDLSLHLPVLRLPAALEPVVRHTLASRDRLHLFERHRYRAAAEEPLAGAEQSTDDGTILQQSGRSSELSLCCNRGHSAILLTPTSSPCTLLPLRVWHVEFSAPDLVRL